MAQLEVLLFWINLKIKSVKIRKLLKTKSFFLRKGVF